MMRSKQIMIGGVRIDNVSMKEALDRMERLIELKKPSYVVTPNADHIVVLQNDEEFKKIYDNAALVVADGMSLIWAGIFLGQPLTEKVSGSDLTPEFCRVAADKGYRLFFLGGRDGAAEGSKKMLEEKYPAIRIVGAYAPPMGFEKDAQEGAKIKQMILDAAPDVLFVGLGSPKQEKWIGRNLSSIGVPVSAGVGATFEFMSGMVRRAPRWMQAAGLEWLWRLLLEPKRLWKRYLVQDPKFFWLVAKQKFSKKESIHG